MTTTFLADKSALARLGDPRVRHVLGPLVERGLVATCWATRLELGQSVRSATEHDEVMADHDVLYPLAATGERAWRRALQVQRELAARGHHRAPGVPDLVVAATAELAGMTVLHYDGDFDLIAAVTGQPTRWVVPRGTV